VCHLHTHKKRSHNRLVYNLCCASTARSLWQCHCHRDRIKCDKTAKLPLDYNTLGTDKRTWYRRKYDLKKTLWADLTRVMLAACSKLNLPFSTHARNFSIKIGLYNKDYILCGRQTWSLALTKRRRECLSKRYREKYLVCGRRKGTDGRELV
jgi:hypothetical protein